MNIHMLIAKILFMLDEHNDTCCTHSFGGINFETLDPVTADSNFLINMLKYAKLFYTFQGESCDSS